MPFVSKRLIVPSLAILAVFAAAGDDKLAFSAKPAASYATRQSNAGVTIAAVPFDSGDLAQSAFGKANPNKYGILPLLLVIQNDSAQTLYLENIRVEFATRDRQRLEPTPAKDVPYVTGPQKPKFDPGPAPAGGPRVKRKKNPLASGIIDVRAFSARMLPAGQSASGFFYFQTVPRRDATAYVTGIREANTGKELFYFDIPLSGGAQ